MDTTVLCRHWGTHLGCHLFPHHSKQRGVVVPSHLIKAGSRYGGYINSLLVGTSSSFSDRKHKIHLWAIIFFIFGLLSFLVSSSIMMMSSAEVTAMDMSAELSLSTIKPNSLLWDCGSWVDNQLFSMDTSGTSLLHLSSLLFQLFTLDTAMTLTDCCCTFSSSFSALHHRYCDRTDTSLLHLLVFFFSSSPWILQWNWHIIIAPSFLLPPPLLLLLVSAWGNPLCPHFYLVLFRVCMGQCKCTLFSSSCPKYY